MKKFIAILLLCLSYTALFSGDSYMHRAATRHAVKLLKVQNAENLIKTYCLYPDRYYGKNHKKIAPYLYLEGDVSFHDIPSISLTTLYQAWVPFEKGQLRRSRKYKNENYLFAEKCFNFYFSNIKKAIAENRIDDMMKFTGCLIHHMQDATFGLHVLEGASGTDVYTLNKFSGTDMMMEIANLRPAEDWFNISAEPTYLGNTVQEAVMRLYSQYVKYNRNACNALFAIAANRIGANDPKILEQNTRKMYLNSLYGTMDILYTVQAWLNKQKIPQNPLSLTDLTPYEPPLSGYGKYRLKMLQINENELEFGVHFEQNIIYHIAENVFENFTADLIAENVNSVKIEVINDGKTIDSFEISGNETKNIKITSPCGVFGLRTSSTAPQGGLIIKNGKFNRKE